MTETLPGAADAEHLSGVLRGCGALAGGRVRAVTVEHSRATLLSRIIRLRLVYEGDARDAPGTIILKTGLAERAGGLWIAGRQEVAFYTQVAAAMPNGLVPRCFESAHDRDSGAWHLLLEDLTESHHIATAWPLPPTIGQCERMLSTLARLHAAWWDHPQLGVSVGTWLDAATVDQWLQRIADRFRAFADRLGDSLSPQRRGLYGQFIAAAPRLLARHHAHRNMTVIHGDAHVWNYFLPRDGGGDVRLFDWDAWRLSVASSDLAYMMATHWYPERRRRMERPLLDHYHAALLAHGVRGYDRGALADDYRLSVLWQLMTPVWQAALDLPPMIWWGHLERICLAIDDLDCREFLQDFPVPGSRPPC
jgi:thiamine kinase-like enzyme